TSANWIRTIAVMLRYQAVASRPIDGRLLQKKAESPSIVTAMIPPRRSQCRLTSRGFGIAVASMVPPQRRMKKASGIFRRRVGGPGGGRRAFVGKCYVEPRLVTQLTSVRTPNPVAPGA